MVEETPDHRLRKPHPNDYNVIAPPAPRERRFFEQMTDAKLAPGQLVQTQVK